MAADQARVTDKVVTRETGESLAFWDEVLDDFGASGKDANEVVIHLQLEHGLDRDWARRLTTRYVKKREGSEKSEKS